MISSPSFQQNRHARLYFHGVRGEDVGDDFQLLRITQRQDRSPRRNNTLAFFDHTQDASCHRSPQLNQRACFARICFQPDKT